jgi:lysophospholipid acyltransferase (LPLAT)-like uncharacterized protein
MIPKPFARITVAFGKPLYVPAGATRAECESIREEVDRRMAELESRCKGTKSQHPNSKFE